MYYRLFFGACLIILPALAQAAQGVQFSAQAIERAPSGVERAAGLFVGDGAVRTEYRANGEPVVEIVVMSRGKRLVIYPSRSEYIEIAGYSAPDLSADQATSNPCTGLSATRCTRIGDVVIDGRKAVKWEMLTKQHDKTVRTLLWIDNVYGFSLKELLPDGALAELRLLGLEKVNGRNTEKWQRIITMPDGTSQNMLQWYDPELKLTVREQLPNGFTRELRQIKLAKQPEELFQIPAGYKKTDPPVRKEADRQQQPAAPALYR
ncbi:MAG TPA: hypothetical protein ENI64_02130 [Gammaproteobacteria bacterium]|nr:hypothetical protein [Gammaproteobacteria bacterium]